MGVEQLHLFPELDEQIRNVSHLVSQSDKEQLDQFFTKPYVATLCWDSLCPILLKLTGKNIKDLCYIEPSAGDGVFFDLLPYGQRIGIDIDPRRNEFLGADFLSLNPSLFTFERSDTVIVGNPPFGKRGKMAVAFFNKASQIADTIAFILPVIFRKYFIHKMLPGNWRWIYSTSLPRQAFWTEKKGDFEVNTEFQIWTRLSSTHENLRLFNPPPLQHNDFEFWQYNNTIQALSVFENDFDFAVPSQGWQDYSRREIHSDKCEKTKQWMLFKPCNDAVYDRLHDDIDYEELAFKSATSIPGFRKGDLVQEYMYRYE